MSFLYGLIAVGVLILLLLGAPAVMRMLPRGGVVAAGSWRTIGMVIGGVVAGIVLITLSMKSTMGWEFWVIFLGLVAAAIVLRGTIPGKWAAGFVVIFLIGYAIFHAIYGKEAGKVAEANQQEVTKATLSASGPGGQTSKSTQPGKVGEATRTVHGNSYKTSITVPRDEMGVAKTNEWSEWLEIPAGCGTAFAHGNGTPFEMEGRLYGGQPFVVPPGNSFPPASHVRSRILPAGEATFGGQDGKVPITIKC